MAKNPAAVSLGKAGGTARAAKMSKAERSQSARNAAAARWKAYKLAKTEHERTGKHSWRYHYNGAATCVVCAALRLGVSEAEEASQKQGNRKRHNKKSA